MADNQIKVSITADNAGLEAGLQKAAASVQSSIGQMTNSFKGLSGLMGGLFSGPMAALAGAAGFGKIIKDTAELGDALIKTSQKVGISVESLSRLKHAADLSDVSLEDLTKGLEKLSKKMMEAASNPASEAASAFQSIGVNVTDSTGKLRNSEAVLGDIAERFSKMNDGAGKTAISMLLFGKAGADLIPLLNQGRAGLAEAAAEAERLGIVFDTKAAAASEQFNDDLTRLHASLKGATQTLGMAVIPALDTLAKAFTTGTGNMTAMQAILTALAWVFKGIAIAIIGIKQTLEMMWEVGKAVFDELLGKATLFAQAAKAVFAGNFQEAGRLMAQNMEESVERGNVLLDNLQKSAEANKKAINEIILGAEGAEAKSGGGKKTDAPIIEDPNRQKMLSNLAFQAELENKLALAMGNRSLEEQKLRKEEQETAKFRADEAKIQERKDITEDQRQKLLVANRQAHLAALKTVETEYLDKTTAEMEKASAAHQKMADELDKATDELAKNSQTLNKVASESAQQLLERNGTALQGWIAGLQEISAKTQTVFQSFRDAAWQVMGEVRNAFAQGIAGMLSGQMTFAQAMKTIWKGIVQAVIQAVAQMIAQWIVASVIKKALGISDTATEGGKTAAALTSATAATWAAYAGIPFAGPILAETQIGVMYASMAASTAASQGIGAGVSAMGRKVGGLITRPELTLMGEAGPEVIAPENSFKDYTAKIFQMGVALFANLNANRTAIQGYQNQASGFASSGFQSSSALAGAAGSGGGATEIHIHQNAPVWDPSHRGLRGMGESFIDATRAAYRERSVVLRYGEVFGGI